MRSTHMRFRIGNLLETSNARECARLAGDARRFPHLLELVPARMRAVRIRIYMRALLKTDEVLQVQHAQISPSVQASSRAVCFNKMMIGSI
jgi:hypothetical protein